PSEARGLPAPRVSRGRVAASSWARSAVVSTAQARTRYTLDDLVDVKLCGLILIRRTDGMSNRSNRFATDSPTAEFDEQPLPWSTVRRGEPNCARWNSEIHFFWAAGAVKPEKNAASWSLGRSAKAVSLLSAATFFSSRNRPAAFAWFNRSKARFAY